jgi:uncharacterized membrane protein
VGIGVILGCEIVHIKDFMGEGGAMSRMNTVFKFYNVIWFYMGLAATVSLARLWPEMQALQKSAQAVRLQQLLAGAGLVLLIWAVLYFYQIDTGASLLAWGLGLGLLGMPLLRLFLGLRNGWFWAWGAVMVACAGILALYAPVSLYNRMRLCSEFKHPTLNGVAYMERMIPPQAQAMGWLREHAAATEVLLEAPGKRGYNCFDSRVSTVTGLPTLIGWVGHEEQMRYNPELTGSRVRDADRIFSTEDLAEAGALIRKYRIRYVYVGDIEKKSYPLPGLEKFARFMDIVYDREGVVIYRSRADATEDGA